VFMRILNTGDNLISISFFVSLYCGFHFATLNEYYVGSLDLPIFNGVSDGSAVLIAILLITAVLGPGFWTI